MLPRRKPVIEVIDDDMAEVLRGKTGFERLRLGGVLFRSASRLIEQSIRNSHPDWDDAAVRRELARRIAGDAG